MLVFDRVRSPADGKESNREAIFIVCKERGVSWSLNRVLHMIQEWMSECLVNTLPGTKLSLGFGLSL